MLKNVRDNVIVPLASRIGTAAATLLVGYGLQSDHAHSIGIIVTSVGLVMADLFADWLQRRAAK